MAALGQEHAVAALAAAEVEHPGPRREPPRDIARERRGPGAKDEAVGRARILPAPRTPALSERFAHRAPARSVRGGSAGRWRGPPPGPGSLRASGASLDRRHPGTGTARSTTRWRSARPP